ncbi:MAG TPA: oligosaccharide flippase family protein [Caulobacteraceae bacterium]|jgi:O-antigen/teichoic acid export membrane protein|nr:oligosaccharide flippase family protein [Caulobacteraceae bacterium]
MNLADDTTIPAAEDQPMRSGSPLRPTPPRRRGANLYLVASLYAQVVALLRYVTLARLLGPAELGLAATFVVTQAFFDLVSDTGSDRFLIQDADGDGEAVQSLVQFVYVARGLLIAACMVVFSTPLAALYHAPQLAIGFMVLALAPAITGFTHMDMRRRQRHHDFRIEAAVMITGDTTSLIVVVTAAILTRSHVAILWGLLCRAAVCTVVSHLLAKRRYVVAYDKSHGPRLARYAAPLVATGVMLFIGGQGDRVFVANQLGVRELGLYSAVLLLIYYPSAVLLRYMHALFVPSIAGARDDPAERDRISDVLGSQTVVLGAAMTVGFAIVAPFAVPLLYGVRYAESVLLIGLIGILQSTRYLINWPTTVALSIGRSSAVMISNLVRLLAYPGAAVGLWLSHSLAGLVGGFVVGEILSIGVAILLLNRNLGRRLSAGFARYARFLAAAALVIAWDLLLPRGAPLVLGGLAVLSAGLAVWTVRSERTGIVTLLEAIGTAMAVLRPRRGSA